MAKQKRSHQTSARAKRNPFIEQLALFGGSPVRKTFLPYAHQWFDHHEIQKVTQVLKSDWITTGPVVQEFEKNFAKYVGARYAVSVNSGTAALHIGCLSLGLKPGDEVITTPFTFVATSNAVLYCGAKPVFVDIEPDTLNINPDKIKKAITRKTKGIIPVHFAGHPCEMDEIHKIAKKYGLWVLEDAAHAVGAQYKGKKIGSLSDATIFSFHPAKNITTGEGGMVTTNSPSLFQKLIMYRTHGIRKDFRSREGSRGDWYYEMELLGYRFNITEMQAAVGLCQLKKLNKFQRRRREIVNLYNEAFSSMTEWVLPFEKSNVVSSWHLYTLRLSPKSGIRANRDLIFKTLRAENIGVNVHYIPVYFHRYYQKIIRIRKGSYSICEDNFTRIISLPLFPKMNNRDVSDVIGAIRKVTNYYRKTRD